MRGFETWARAAAAFGGVSVVRVHSKTQSMRQCKNYKAIRRLLFH
jgi:hypothetical protein